MSTNPAALAAKTLFPLLALALLLSATGCTSLVPVTHELATSQSTFTINLTTVYGTLKVVRIGQTNATISIDPSGVVTVKP